MSGKNGTEKENIPHVEMPDSKSIQRFGFSFRFRFRFRGPYFLLLLPVLLPHKAHVTMPFASLLLSDPALLPLPPSPSPSQLRPPPHPPITRHHLPESLLGDPLPRILERSDPLEPTPIETEIRIFQQLLLHEGREGSGPRDVGGGEEIGPGLEDLFVQVVDDVVEVQAREGGDQGSLEAGRDGEDGAYVGGHGALCCDGSRCAVSRV